MLGFFSGYSQFVCGTSTVTDIDGNVYHTVQIGSQCWMKENMNAIHYANGTLVSIPEVKGIDLRNVINRPGEFRINIILPGNGTNVDISIIDLQGRLKFRKGVSCESGSNCLECDVGPAGAYFLMVTYGKKFECFKVIGADSDVMDVRLYPFAQNVKSYVDTIILSSDSRYAFDYNNDPANGLVYGKLYTALSALNTDQYTDVIQGVCPNGWHIPSDQEWLTMEIFAGMSPSAANQMMSYRDIIANKFKTIGTDFWITAKGTDEFGFSAMGGGMYYDQIGWGFYYLKDRGTWWTYGFDNLMIRQVTDFQAGIWRGVTIPNWAVSVRCIMD